jgi:hypothetical protein
MWMVDPKIMCQKHLCGEHLELHMFLSHIKAGKKVDGYLKNNCLEPRMIWKRHCDIESEMLKRSYNPKTPIYGHDCLCILDLATEQQYWEINKEKSLNDLLERCPRCRERFREQNNET